MTDSTAVHIGGVPLHEGPVPDSMTIGEALRRVILHSTDPKLSPEGQKALGGVNQNMVAVGASRKPTLATNTPPVTSPVETQIEQPQARCPRGDKMKLVPSIARIRSDVLPRRKITKKIKTGSTRDRKEKRELVRLVKAELEGKRTEKLNKR
jgi:hypothetical protein